MEIAAGILEWIDTWLLNGLVMAALLGCGVWFTLKTGVYQARGIPFILYHTAGALLKKEKPAEKGRGISPFQAMTTALAGTMGVGNIAGVATALVAGGPGAVFWMWVSAFFGMMTKYAEIVLAVRFRRTGRDGRFFGGPMYYMESGAGSKWLAASFAVLCALCSLGIGNMTQVNSAATVLESTFGIPSLISGILVMLIVTLVVFGGLRRIARVTEMLIPFVSILYLFGAGAFLWLHRDLLGGALTDIVVSAFSPRPAAGGLLGFGVARAMRYGLARGVFTNEAGLGSASIAHAAADCKSPQHQAVWGIFEVFLDTMVVCTITALVLLCAGDGQLWSSGVLDGAALTAAAFETVFGRAGASFIAVSILLFAVTAMLGWCYYGECSLEYLAGGRRMVPLLYRLVFLVCIIPGATGSLTAVWALSDCFNALMAVPNLIALFMLSKLVRTTPEPLSQKIK